MKNPTHECLYVHCKKKLCLSMCTWTVINVIKSCFQEVTHYKATMLKSFNLSVCFFHLQLYEIVFQICKWYKIGFNVFGILNFRPLVEILSFWQKNLEMVRLSVYLLQYYEDKYYLLWNKHNFVLFLVWKMAIRGKTWNLLIFHIKKHFWWMK